MCVRVLLKEHVGTLPRAIVGLVLLGSDDPVPTELLEVHRQRISTAALLLRRFVAVQADSALRPVFPAVRCIQFNKWNLHRTEIIALAVKETVPSDLCDLSRYTLAYLLTPYQLHNTENLNVTMIIRQLRYYIADRTRTGVVLISRTSNTDIWSSKRLSGQNFSSESDSRSRDPLPSMERKVHRRNHKSPPLGPNRTAHTATRCFTMCRACADVVTVSRADARRRSGCMFLISSAFHMRVPPEPQEIFSKKESRLLLPSEHERRLAVLRVACTQEDAQGLRPFL